jgi:serine/threonine protein kinase
MLIESRVTQQQLSPDVGRALIDAIESDAETYQPDKTMWLAPSASNSPDIPPTATIAPSVTSSDVLRVPTKARIEPQFQDMEQLRAFLWDGPASKHTNTNANTTPAESMTERVPPPRPMPGSIPLLDAPELGSIIKGRYRLDKHLGYGGIGQVFSATDLEVARSGLKNSHVTLKMIAVDLKHEPQARAAIQSVIANTKTLRHANIVSVYGVEHDNDRLFVIMEPLSGTWLGDQIRLVRKVGIVQSVAWPIIEGIANGLAHAHNNNIVHSDLSPYSIFVTEDGTPKIMGFGMIHALPTSNEAMDLLDTMTLRAYSEAYTADTWATHATPHPSDDLYPLGTIAYEMLTGTHPFNRNSLTSARQKNLKYEPVAGLNRRASKLIAHCLSFERAERPKNAARFVKRMQGSELLRTLFGDRFSVAGPNSEK